MRDTNSKTEVTDTLRNTSLKTPSEKEPETGKKLSVAVVILNWNGRALLEEFLPVMIRHNHPQATIYVADNASTDDSVEFLATRYPDIKIIRNQDNYGFARGYNTALQHVQADIFCLINSDIEVTEGWLTPVIEAFEKDPELVAAQPKLLDYKKREYFEYAGAAGGFIDKLGYPYCRGRLFTELEKDCGQYENSVPVLWATGACMFVRSDNFRHAGGFDPDFFAHLEEIDLCWRLWNYNWKVRCLPASKVYHVGGATLKQGSSHKTYLNFRNSLYTLVKNLPAYRIPYVIPARLVLDGIQAVRFLFERKPKHVLALFRAHLIFYKNFYRMWKKRSLTPVKQRNYYNATCIVFSFFARGKKTVGEL